MLKTHTLTFCFLLVSFFAATTCTKTDISCLKSIQSSLQDPNGILSSTWNWSLAKDNSDSFLCTFAGIECWNNIDGKVLNLQLSNMGLKGQFPSGINNCKYITGLNLSNNELQGPIPPDISKKLKFLTILDLSSNQFTGEIPSDIANCSYLSVLNLANNSLTGFIPREIGHLERIKTFSVAHNMLTGPVPVFVNVTIEPESYADNLDLCGGPLNRCIDENYRGKFDFSFKSGFLISYVAFAISTIVVYASYCVPWLQTGKKNDFITVSELVVSMMKTKENQPDVDQLKSLSTLQFILENEISTSEKFVTRMSYRDLKKATENFSQENIVGFGETGTVYKATLPNGWSLAVKKFSNSQNSEDHFITELKILGKLRHHNINPLIGFCKESTERLLIYNYASNGSLSDWLYTSDKKALNWPLRMKIAVGLARGLAWLHHCCDYRVAHLNLSSKSVLLDQNFEPKLANFGMATLVKLNEVNESFVMDMEFWEQCFVKEDVVGFGGVLMELVTGRKCGVEDVVVDEVLRGGGFEDEISECVRIAKRCVQQFPEQRPSMLDVYARISIIRDRFGH